MKITTLSIGDELLFGEVVDTNAAGIAARLYDRGIKVQRHLLVGDSEPDIMNAIETLAERSDAVIVTGGLGPTADDLTARAAAKVTSRRLVPNEEAVAHMMAFMGSDASSFHAATDKQTLLPIRSIVIPNPLGTACGFIITWNGRYLIFLPGVPSEMIRMIDDTVLPFLVERWRQKTTVKTRGLTVFGISEAELDQLAREVPLPEGVEAAFCVKFPLIELKFRMEGESESLVEESLEAALQIMREKLGRIVVAEGNVTLEEEVGRLCRNAGVTLALAESCTGGLIATRLTDIAGSSAYLLEGMVAYSNGAKTRSLKVPAELIRTKGAVSADVAKAMARGVKKAAGSDIALAVTGVAGPGASEEKPAGLVYIALASGRSCQVQEFRFQGNRHQIRTLTVTVALDWLRRHLLSR